MKDKLAGHFKLLFDISELVELVTGSSDLESFFQRSVDLVAGHFSAPVCSIYLFNEKLKCLTLRATRGLNPYAVGKISMKPGEGLVGQSFEHLSTVREGDASKSPGYKYFAEAGEDAFNSLLCAPIKRGLEKIGVLVVQHHDVNHFDVSDERAIRAVVNQLAGAVENARLLMELSLVKEEPEDVQPIGLVKAKAVTGGVALGRAMVLHEKKTSILYDPLFPEEGFTRQDFLTALERTEKELDALQKEFARRLPESASLIFTAHFMILRDKKFTGKILELIDGGIFPCDAVRQVASKYIAIFSGSPHAYMQEKAQDVKDLSVRILNNFAAPEEDNGDDSECRYKKGSIAISRQVFPSDILKLVSAGVKGIVLASGGVTSHVTILARSLQIPLLIVQDSRLLSLSDGITVLLDGELGNIFVNPEKETIALFETRQKTETRARSVSMQDETWTKDNEQVRLMANINLLSEVAIAGSLKAEGIGLYRTEFPFLIRATFPSEAEQYVIYKQLMDAMPASPVCLRTLDAGGEKALAYSDSPEEANPELGLRSIRFSLKHQEVFECQLRAMLRAAAGRKDVRIMFPLISSIDEFLQAKKILSDCMDDLEAEGLEFCREVSVGIMIELPSVLETIDEFARLADFFSIGTNDFIQYMLAADRANKMVADYYIPCHPAVNRGIGKIAAAAVKHRIEVSVCGEMAHEPEAIPFLLGVGIRTLSVDPQFLPEVQKIVMGLSVSETKAYADRLLAEYTIKGARAVVDTLQL